MKKIKKNLSDADMFRGEQEEYSFENDILEDNVQIKKFRETVNKRKEKKSELPVSEDTQEKLNRCILEASMEWLRQGGGENRWSIQRSGVEITMKLVPEKSKNKR